jgi:queuine tRNA-ribosyltransferase
MVAILTLDAYDDCPWQNNKNRGHDSFGNNPMTFTFTLQAQQGYARAGIFETPHGSIPTPVFAPVGTQATVKAVKPHELAEMGASLILANTYHLYLRPGDRLIRELGGLHRFMNWQGPILTDSGGFQVFSLGDLRKIDDDGVTFRSHIDGSKHRFTPEVSIGIQHHLGADVIMAFDECPVPTDRAAVEASLIRTHNWAERCLEYHHRKGDPQQQALFGIVQGGIFHDLRAYSAQTLMKMDFPGYAIGGLAVGETKPEMYETLDHLMPILPSHTPRYLMGVGMPDDLVEAVWRGVDIFDCVLPTREARHGAALTRCGRLNIRKAAYEKDTRPLVEGCTCYCCTHFTRAYVRHLHRANEILAHILLSLHNVHFLLTMMSDMRQAIFEGTLDRYRAAFLSDWRSHQTH